MGTIRICLWPDWDARTSFAWLPRIDVTSKPKSPRMRTISREESRLSRGIRSQPTLLPR